jgi:hypothetical protein
MDRYTEHRADERIRRTEERMRRPAATLMIMGLALALVVSACTNGVDPGATPGAGRSPTSEPPATIEQPVVTDLPIAPDSARVDLTMPSFSNPTNITNPLFPVSSQQSVLLVGQVDDQPFRTEVTLLPDSRIIEWQGQAVETLVSQYAAYLGGRIHEIAYDFYAQADDGSVWYLGEDVFNFRDGVISDTHGTWIAGKDGPAAMIMPGNPQVGDVYRPENIPGFVFEEVTIKSVDQTLDGPFGPIDGGLLVEELHMDGTTEEKSFAPGYGEFYTAGGGDVEALALAVPTDALSGPTPAELETLSSGALGIFDAAASKDWSSASATVQEMTAAWDTYKTGEVPALIEPQMTGALEALARAVDARKSGQARQAAIDAAQWSLDLQLRHRPPVEIDLARFDLWAAQLQVDAAAENGAAVNGDFFTIDYIRDRILHALSAADGTRLNTQLEELVSAVGDEDFAAASEAAAGIRDTLAGLQPQG